ACSSPASFTSLADGVHTFTVSAVDVVSNADPTPASASWTVDTTAPSLTLDSGPSGSGASATAAFSFTAEAGPTGGGRPHGGAWDTCPSPVAYPGLADGSHTFDVRATDAATNTTTVSQGWTVDTTGPGTSITSGPAASTTATSATFTFTSDEDGVTFECRLD